MRQERRSRISRTLRKVTDHRGANIALWAGCAFGAGAFALKGLGRAEGKDFWIMIAFASSLASPKALKAALQVYAQIRSPGD